MVVPDSSFSWRIPLAQMPNEAYSSVVYRSRTKERAIGHRDRPMSDVDIEGSDIFDVFLSHSHADAPIIEPLGKKIEDEARLRVWLDKWVLIPGTKWQQEMAIGLHRARTCAVCIGKHTPTG